MAVSWPRAQSQRQIMLSSYLCLFRSVLKDLTIDRLPTNLYERGAQVGTFA